MKRIPWPTLALVPAILVCGPCCAQAAGTLKPKGSTAQAITIQDHHVDVVIRDGFARTTVKQTFANPNGTPLEAIYSFPLPKSAALSEVTVAAGDEVTLRGEVVAREQARTTYENERDQGNDAALAEKNGYQTFDFAIANVKPNAPTTIEFVYYQNLAVDTGIGRYLYPLEDGGTDETRAPFWETNDQVVGQTSIHVDIKSAYPIEKVFAPGLAGANVQSTDPCHHVLDWSAGQGKLDKDFMFYYALEDSLPGRVELVPYRADEKSDGTFMLVVTPGIDLKPLAKTGSDFTFVLDVSGSMSAKLAILADGVARSLATLQVNDRFRIITFNDSARVLTRGFLPVSPETVRAGIEQVKQLQSSGGTNLEGGIRLALNDLEADRAQSILLVTDGVANIGEVSPQAFVKLLDKIDVRVFGFLLGNSSNWPLVEAIAKTSGGFYECVSNQDDIVSRLALVKQKLTHEAMHGVKLDIGGDADVYDVDDAWFGNLYAGQQLVVFGRYRKPGRVEVKLECKITGEDKCYDTDFTLPAVDVASPELERLFGLHRVETIDGAVNRGLADATEAKSAIRDLGLQYQIVTDETSMLVLSDEAFARHGVERKNKTRADIEQVARAAAQQPNAPVVDRRVDQHKPMFHAPSFSRRSGAIDGMFVLASGLILVVVLLGTRRAA